MKKSIGLSLVAATLLAGSVMAEDSGKLTGDIRALYMSVGGDTGYGDKGEDSASALSAGANFLYESPKMGAMSFGIGFTAQSNVFESSVNNFDGTTYSTAGVANDMAIEENAHINQLYAVYDSAIGTIKAGRQILETPMATSDDVRLTPNTFQAVALINTTAIPNTTIVGAQVATMQGWDSAGGIGSHVAMTNAALGTATADADDGATLYNVEANGATVVGLVYGQDALSAQFWTYNILNTTSAMLSGDSSTATAVTPIEISPVMLNYLDVGYGLDLGGMKLNLAAQYYSFTADIEAYSTTTGKTSKIGSGVNLDHTVNGAKAELEMDMGLSVLVAMNNADVDKKSFAGGVINAWGGYSEYAIADEYWMNSFGNGSFSTMKIGAGYAMDDLSVGAYMTTFSGDKKRGDDESASIMDVTASYGDFALVYETQDVTKTDASGDDDTSATVAKVYYTTAF